MKKDKRAENLIPEAHKLTAEERSKGGINSGEVRRERKRASVVVESILSGSLRKEDAPEGIEIEDADIITGIIAQLTRKALDGNIRAAEMVLTISGDYSKKMELDTNNVIIEDASLRRMKKDMEYYDVFARWPTEGEVDYDEDTY